MHIHSHGPGTATWTRPKVHHLGSYIPTSATSILTTPVVTRNQTLPLESSPPDDLDPHVTKTGALRILIPISVAAWILFGASCILCINGKGRAGRWVPEWYLDSAGSRWDRAMVAAWWLAVMLLWPAILPALLAGKMVRAVRKALKGARRKQKQSDEESQATVEKDGGGGNA